MRHPDTYASHQGPFGQVPVTQGTATPHGVVIDGGRDGAGADDGRATVPDPLAAACHGRGLVDGGRSDPPEPRVAEPPNERPAAGHVDAITPALGTSVPPVASRTAAADADGGLYLDAEPTWVDAAAYQVQGDSGRYTLALACADPGDPLGHYVPVGGMEADGGSKADGAAPSGSGTATVGEGGHTAAGGELAGDLHRARTADNTRPEPQPRSQQTTRVSAPAASPVVTVAAIGKPGAKPGMRRPRRVEPPTNPPAPRVPLAEFLSDCKARGRAARERRHAMPPGPTASGLRLPD